MLFTAPEFAFLFLPASFLGFVISLRFGTAPALVWLVAASLGFYAYWNPVYLIFLILSIALNYGAGQIINSLAIGRLRLAVAATAISANLLFLIFFKYTSFILNNLNTFLYSPVPVPNIILPLGISFITFQKIAYIADVYAGKVRSRGPLRFAFFVTFFPQLIAGPISHHSEILPQLDCGFRLNFRSIAVGLSLFALGLFKKVLIADNLSPVADAAFLVTDSGNMIACLSAWAGMLSYTLELYFDFSGYSDMACGLALMFGIRLPINFFSPYKSASIVEFWRRWHMTLSRFLRDYIYISLGGNRKGVIRTNLNLMITMVIGGFWHGASWTFAIWGGYHGVLLLANHMWQRLRRQDNLQDGPLMMAASITLTFLAVNLGWVLFKSGTIGGAGRMFMSLAVGGSNVPQILDVTDFIRIAAALGIVWMFPNSFQIFRRYRPAIGQIPIFQRRLEWRPSIASALAAACCAALAFMPNRPTLSFLYFQF